MGVVCFARVSKIQEWLARWLRHDYATTCIYIYRYASNFGPANLVLDINSHKLKEMVDFYVCSSLVAVCLTDIKMEASISPEIPVTEVRKSWFAEPETSPNGSPTVRVTLQQPKTIMQLRFFKLR